MDKQNKKRLAEGAVVVGTIAAVWYLWPHINLYLGNVFGNKFGMPGANQTANDTDTAGSAATSSAGAADSSNSSKGTTSSTANMNQTDAHGAKAGTLIYPDDCVITTPSGSRPCTDQEWQESASPATAVNGTGYVGNVQGFIADYKGLINQLSAQTGIQPGIILAIAGIESTYKDANGNWQFGLHPNVANANNYFNIKADNSWTGDVYQDASGRSWRSYSSPEDSIRDIYSFLTTQPNYKAAGLFNSTDMASQAQALQAAGYAGDDNSYANNLYAIAVKSKLLFDQTADKYNAAGLSWFPIVVTVGIGVALFGGVELVGSKKK